MSLTGSANTGLGAVQAWHPSPIAITETGGSDAGLVAFPHIDALGSARAATSTNAAVLVTLPMNHRTW